MRVSSAVLPLHLADCLREVVGPAERGGPCDREVVALCAQAGASKLQRNASFS